MPGIPISSEAGVSFSVLISKPTTFYCQSLFFPSSSVFCSIDSEFCKFCSLSLTCASPIPLLSLVWLFPVRLGLFLSSSIGSSISIGSLSDKAGWLAFFSFPPSNADLLLVYCIKASWSVLPGLACYTLFSYCLLTHPFSSPSQSCLPQINSYLLLYS